MSKKERDSHPCKLLVEGANDLYVVANLRDKHNLETLFVPIVPKDNLSSGGVDEVLKDIPIRIGSQVTKTLGIMVDADNKPVEQWSRVRNVLPEPFQQITPVVPVLDGWVSDPLMYLGDYKRIGIWLMPNIAEQSGYLEDFVLRLIPENNFFLEKARSTLAELEGNEAILEQRFDSRYYSKALVNTWLSWQHRPAQPMGRAIALNYLHHDAPHALTFIAWLRRLFDLLLALEVA